MAPMQNRAPITPSTEMLDRLRRIETRLTKFMEAQGFETQVARAEYRGGAIYVPSRVIGINEVLAAMPQGNLSFAVRLPDGEIIGYVTRP